MLLIARRYCPASINNAARLLSVLDSSSNDGRSWSRELMVLIVGFFFFLLLLMMMMMVDYMSCILDFRDKK